MTSQKLLKALEDIETAKEAFEYMEDLSDGTVNRWRRLFHLPGEYSSIQFAHKVRNTIMSALSNYYGVEHLDGARFESTGLRKLEEARELLEIYLEKFDTAEYRKMHRFLVGYDKNGKSIDTTEIF